MYTIICVRGGRMRVLESRSLCVCVCACFVLCVWEENHLKFTTHTDKDKRRVSQVLAFSIVRIC
jgi:hypothetical protein